MKIIDVLSPNEQGHVQKFVENEALMSAVKKVLLFTAYYNGTMKKGDNPDPNYNIALALVGKDKNDDKIGRDVRTLAEAIRVIETGFIDLYNFKKIEKKDKKETNPAR